MTKKLPLIELQINPDDDSFVSAISLVNAPAVESSFIAFSSNTKNYQFADDEKRELIGIAMKANTAIYRNDPQIGEYTVAFSADTIRLIAQTFFQKNLSKSMNLEHSTTNAESFIFQSYIVDSSKGMFAPKGIDDAGDGDWIVGTKVTSDKVWDDVKSGKFTGYSVEGFFIPKDLNEFIDVQMKKADADMLEFAKEFEAELDAIIAKYGL
ncbi:XkdF-like putative serine protease domain-containing protein [Pedobacter sp. CFBP9032]|uniref:XkdF-like putative serine protease domain-containing protein n=1 Tax=Pedobacter sp. CFBP9032 TaxID=3096539 RepID=UPI002A6AD97C|nr:XkdF-like putative serine protease domain-containing protein [Pedobacter sp. CFBP9032]MDY0906574.1 XkdF-like putative serine protease domain-containing protein [Pedobacter sp. CFBP9032]